VDESATGSANPFPGVSLDPPPDELALVGRDGGELEPVELLLVSAQSPAA
jgi:hypothetical protein